MSERLNGPSDQYYMEDFRGSKKKYDQIGGEVQDVFTRVMKDVFTTRHGEEKGNDLFGEIQSGIERELSDHYTIAALLRRHGEGDIVGFTYAYPLRTPEWYMDDSTGLRLKEMEARKLDPMEFECIEEKTAQVGWTVIREEHRGKGGWTLMMNNLDTQLASNSFDYTTRLVRMENGYSEKMRRRYGEKIVYESFYDNPNWLGEQMYFRVKLK